MLFPLHIATRGRLDGEYGIATRGYVICPDIVPRFPGLAEVRPRVPVGALELEGLRAEMLSDRAAAILVEAKLDIDLELPRASAEVASVALGAELEMIVALAVVDEELVAADLEADIRVGDMADDDLRGILAGEALVGDSTDGPPRC